MATRKLIRTQIAANVVLITWTGLLNGDDGEPVELVDFADCSIEFGGVFGVGGTIVLEGGNSQAYFTLSDAQTNPISKTGAALEQVAEVCRYMRPRVTGGDGTTAMIAALYARRSVK